MMSERAAGAAELIPTAGRVADIPPTEGAGPTAVRDRGSPSPAAQGLLALVIYLATCLAFGALPLLLHPATPMIDQASPDANFYVWSLRWWPYAISHGLDPLRTTLIGAPAGYNLAWATTIGTIAVLVFPVTAIAGPLVTFNLLVLFAIPAAGWATFVLCRRLTGEFLPSLVAGAVYGFSAYEINHVGSGQLNLGFSMLLPLIAYLVVLWRDGAIGSALFVGLLGLAMTAQLYLFLETFAVMTVVWAVALLIGYALAGRANRRTVARLGMLVGLAYLIALALGAVYIVFALVHTPPGFARKPQYYALDMESLVVPRPHRNLGMAWLAHLESLPPLGSAACYVGIPLLAVMIALAVRARRSRLAWFLVIMVVFVILGAAGPILEAGGHDVVRLPWAHLWYLPVMRSSYPERFIIFAYLALAVIVALWLRRSQNPAWLRWLTAVIVVAAIVQDTSGTHLAWQTDQSPAFITAGEYRHYLKPGETVLVESDRGNAGMLWQAQTDFYMRLAGGFINAAIKTDVPTVVVSLQHRMLVSTVDFEHALYEDKIGAILVEQDMAPGWTQLLPRVGLTGKAIGGVIVYEFGPHRRHHHGVRAHIVARHDHARESSAHAGQR
jgi:hypothetical protein